MVTSETYNESEIIEQVLAGQKSRYALIVKRFNPYLYKVGRSYNYNHEDTEDLMQETFIDAYKNLPQFEGRSDFKTWIMRIMMNNCFRKKQKSSFKNEIMQELNENATPMFNHANNETEKLVQNHELGNLIENALGKIPFDYRMVFSLREITGLNVSETAKMLDITENNVKVRLNRSKTLLRNELEKEYSTMELFEFNLKYCDPMVKRVMDIINEI